MNYPRDDHYADHWYKPVQKAKCRNGSRSAVIAMFVGFIVFAVLSYFICGGKI